MANLTMPSTSREDGNDVGVGGDDSSNNGPRPSSPPSRPPSPPEGWDRCHVYLEKKHRFCRQTPVPDPGRLAGIGDDVEAFGGNGRLTQLCPRYCGNHAHLRALVAPEGGFPTEAPGGVSPTPPHPLPAVDESRISHRRRRRGDAECRGKRVPCPIDPSHSVYETDVARHSAVCPAAKRRREESSRAYYREGVNLGGHGSPGGAFEIAVNGGGGVGDGAESGRRERAGRLALAVLCAFDAAFLGTEDGADCERNGRRRRSADITEEEIYGALPECDLSRLEDAGGGAGGGDGSRGGRLTEAVERQQIKAGGARHLRQIASILGHLRRGGLMPPLPPPAPPPDFGSTVATIEAVAPRGATTVLEMGAGRGMLGLVVAGALGASLPAKVPAAAGEEGRGGDASPVKLVLVERSGTRAKAETKIRKSIRDAAKAASTRGGGERAKRDREKVTNGDGEGNRGESREDSVLRLDRVEVTRIKCDLAHVHLPSALSLSKDRDSPTVGGGNDGTDRGHAKPEGRILVVAKHLCGAGTDLALKSLMDLIGAAGGASRKGVGVDSSGRVAGTVGIDRIEGVAMATCCHGLCTWNDYVGRERLLQLFRGWRRDPDAAGRRGEDAETEGAEAAPISAAFGGEEFDLLRRWSSASVLRDDSELRSDRRGDVEDDDHPPVRSEESDGGCSATSIVNDLGLACGHRGLGRACQRLIDHGRCEFMRKHLFAATKNNVDGNSGTRSGKEEEAREDVFNVSMFHYVNRKVTPQNALLFAYRVQAKE